MTEFSLYEKWRCANREVRLRRQVYPKWIERGTMNEAKAKWQIACMEAIADEYHKQWQAAGAVLPSDDQSHLW